MLALISELTSNIPVAHFNQAVQIYVNSFCFMKVHLTNCTKLCRPFALKSTFAEASSRLSAGGSEEQWENANAFTEVHCIYLFTSIRITASSLQCETSEQSTSNPLCTWIIRIILVGRNKWEKHEIPFNLPLILLYARFLNFRHSATSDSKHV